MKQTSMNMTEGSIIKKMLGFAIPVLIGNIFQQMYNIVDTAVIGNVLGDNALASIGAAAPVYALMINFTEGMTNGFAVVVARFFGAGDKQTMKRAVSLTYILSAIMAVVLTLVSVSAINPLLVLLKTPENIISDTSGYMKIILAFLTVTVAYNMLAGMMRAIGNSRVPLYFLMVSTFANIGLDILFVKGFSMGIPGAAYATVIAQGVSAVLCLIYCFKKCPELIFGTKEFVFEKTLLLELINTGLAMGLMEAIVYIGSVIMQGAVNSFGTVTIAAHTAARKIHDVFTLPIGTIAMAASTFASQNYGAEKMDRVKKGLRYSIFISFAWSAFALIVMLLFRRLMIQGLTGTANAEVIDTASKYMCWNIPFLFILSILLVLRNGLQGVGRKIVPICGSIVELVMKIAAAAILAPMLGYLGICICEPLIWALSSVLVIWDYRRFSRTR
ncbi:MAG: MATE family efflux transporter [Lachnospiraceae bacterium]|nr:MATE family efflux transporter [Lachnospiraceae bacterium]